MYYVKQSAPDGGDGSESAPLNALASLPSLTLGDRVRFLDDYTGQLLYDASKGDHGESGNEIVFEGWTDGDDPTIRHTGWCVDIQGRDYVIVQNLRAGPVGSYCDGGIRFLNSAHGKAQYCTTEDRCDYGIRIDNTGSSALVGVEVLDNDILGTFNNSGIMVFWGESEGGVFVDVQIKRNVVRNTGRYASSGEHSPYGIRFVPRSAALTADEGATDLDLFTCGVECEDNIVTDTAAYGIAFAAVGSGHSATLRNSVRGNVLRRNGNGLYDSHVIWVAGCRDVTVEHNDIDGSIVYAGHAFGTGVGIFVDNFGFENLYNSSKRCTVRRNVVRRTGQSPETSSADSLETVGAAIAVFLSQDISILANVCEECTNGIAVIGWYGGASAKTENVTVRGNRVADAVQNCFTVIKAADSVALVENWGEGFGGSGVYVETAGAYAVTNYSETRNNIVGDVATAFTGGSLPTSGATPIALRIPDSGNLALPIEFDEMKTAV